MAFRLVDSPLHLHRKRRCRIQAIIPLLDFYEHIGDDRESSPFFIYLLHMKKLVLFLSLIIYSASLAAQNPKPNIIFVLVDDMGYSDLSCYGGEIKTPNIDRLAEQGIKMRNFYNNARCCPTRASLLSGRYPHAVGIGHMVSLPTDSTTPGSYQGYLDPTAPTIAEELKKAGYSTFMTGKWHVGERKEHWPLKRGFDRYYGLISGASSFWEITPEEKFKRIFVSDDREIELPQQGFYATDAYTDSAISFLNTHHIKNKQKPFFLYLAYTAPHYPLHAYEEDIVKYEKIYAKGWDKIREERYAKQKSLGYVDQRYQLTPKTPDLEAWENQSPKEKEASIRKMAVHAAMVDRLDQNLGRLIQYLKDAGKWENTMLVFLSDNGASAETVNTKKLHDPSTKIGEKGSYASIGINWANTSNTPFKLYKHNVHEGGIATPFIIHWPSGIKAQKGYANGVGHVIDLMPTALEVAGLSVKNTDGQSLSWLWNGSKEPARSVFWEHENNMCLRKGRWKLVRENNESTWSLYDLENDPTEMKDLSTSDPLRTQSLIAEYTTWSVRVGVKEFKGKIMQNGK